MDSTNRASIDDRIGNRLRRLRTAAGRNQTEVGEIIDVTFQQIQRYENGSNRISSSDLYIMAQHLGIPIAAFFEGLDDEDKDNSTFITQMAEADLASSRNHREVLAMAKYYAAISNPKQRQMVRDLVKLLAGPEVPKRR